MPRRSGLGPQGRQALQRAAATQIEINAARRNQDRPVGLRRRVNPGITTTEQPNEEAVERSLQWLPFQSSRVSEAAYDSSSAQLFVRFQRPAPGQDEYVYEGVGTNEWRNFRRSASPGRYINRILNGKNYHRVN